MSQTHDRFHGLTTDEYIASGPEELARDAVSFWEIVLHGREGYGLSGPDLIDFVRRNLLELFAHGAKPVMGGDKVYLWGRVTKYGDEPKETADAIIDEWQKSGRDPDIGGVWFATPNVFEEKRNEGAARRAD
jgi:hypothetical protein